MAQVSLPRKLAYAASGFGGSICLGAMTYLMYFYTDVALLGVGLAGLASGLGTVFDALNDPVVGYLSDKTQTRWGRRRPWIAAAILPAVALYILLFRPPETTSQHFLFAYFLGALLFLDAFGTMIYIPAAALGLELTSDYQERTQIFALGTFFNNVGTILGGFLPFAVAHFTDVRTGYARVTLLFAVISALTTPLVLFAPERTRPSRGAALGLGDFVQGYRTCLHNREFRTLLVTFLAVNLGSGIGGTVAVYALIYWLGFTQSEIGLIIPVYLGASCLALPFWTWLSGHIGKDAALKKLFFYGVCVYSGIYFLVPNKLIVYTFMIAAGFG